MKEAQVLQKSLYAAWWLVSAVTGHCKQRKLFVGGFSDSNQRECTDEEKLDHAMSIALNHIEQLGQFTNALENKSLTEK